MEFKKREPPFSEEHEMKRARVAEAEPSELSKSKQRVVLNPADCDLDFNIEGSGLIGSGLHEQGFAYCWSGSRANVGIIGGKYCFSCKIISAQPVDMEDTPLDKQHVCRLGISRGDDMVGNLGETEQSFGFGGTGKFSNAGIFSDYGEKYGVGDTILCAVNLESKPMAFIGFSKNGKWIGIAKHFNPGVNGLGVVDSPFSKMPWGSAIFPHVLLKNVVVQLQFSVEDGLVPEEGYEPWASAHKDGNTVMGPTFSDPQNCEVLMMVGLPASGKTTWAEKYAKEHAEKRYILLGTNHVLDQMKVPGLLRKNNYGERFDCLMDRATGIFNNLLSRASRTPRNFIIDQTNVYKSARKRKLKPFAIYQKIAVVVFPKPEELKVRASKRFKEMGKEVPAEAVNEMLANYVLPLSKDMPGADEYFDQVIFTDLDRTDSQRHLDEMKSNVNSRRELSPYSCEKSIQSYGSPMPEFCNSSVQSYNRFSPQNRETFRSYISVPEPCSSFRNSYGPHSQNQGALPVTSVSWPSYDSASSHIPMSTTYGNYYGSGAFIPSGNSNRHFNYDGYDQYRNADIGSRIRTQAVVSDPYQTYGLGDSFSHHNIESRFSFGYNDGAYHSVQEHKLADLPLQRQNLPLQMRPTGYGTAASHGPSSRLPQVNFARGMEPPGAYAHPRPGFY